MNKALSNFLEAVRSAVTEPLKLNVSEPFAPEGIWFVDISLEGYELLVQYSDTLGFGISADASEFGNAPDEQMASIEEAVHRAALLLTSRGKTIPSKTLSGLRGRETQTDVAHAMEMKQPSYAKMEGKRLSTFKVETLEKAVGAMHGTLHLVVEINGKAYVLRDPASKSREAYEPRENYSLPLSLVAVDSSRLQVDNYSRSLPGTIITGHFPRQSKPETRRPPSASTRPSKRSSKKVEARVSK